MEHGLAPPRGARRRRGGETIAAPAQAVSDAHDAPDKAPSLVYPGTTTHPQPEEPETEPKAPEFPGCAGKIRTLFCTNCGYLHPIPITCDRRTCPDCARRRYWDLKERYEPLQNYVENPKFVTLTLKRYPIGHPKDDVAELVDRIIDAHKKLRRRKLCRYVQGGFYAIEIKPPDPERDLGWFVHIHALWDGPYIPGKKLKAAWEEITGDSHRVEIEHTRKPDSAVSYVLGYTTAGPKIKHDWQDQPEDIRHTFEDAIEGRRLLQPFGHLHGKQIQPPKFHCPNCEAHSWTLLDYDPPLAEQVGIPPWLGMTPRERLREMYAKPDKTTSPKGVLA